MKKQIISALATMCLVSAAFGQDAMQCRQAEEDLSEVSAQLAEAYGAGEAGKAKAVIEKAQAALDKGMGSAKDCGCTATQPKGEKTRSMLGDTLKAGDYTAMQDKLFDVVRQSEETRKSAEDCWRARAAAAKK